MPQVAQQTNSHTASRKQNLAAYGDAAKPKQKHAGQLAQASQGLAVVGCLLIKAKLCL